MSLPLPDIGRLAMQNPLPAFVIIFVSLLLAVEAGRRLPRRGAAEPSGGVSLMDGAVFALMGLLVAFSFSAAAGRFETRRDLIVAEANAIGTARLRLDLLPAARRALLQGLFDAYIEGRMASSAASANPGRFRADLARDQARQAEIWAAAVAAVRDEAAPPSAAMLLLPALNEMFDITTTRAALLAAHNPPLIYVLLWGAAIIAALLAGTGLPLRGHGRQHEIGFAAVLTLALYVIVDFDYPRLGLIRVDRFDAALAAQASAD